MTVTCHGWNCPRPHEITEADASWLLEQFSEGDWEDGPRCLLEVLDARGSS